MHISMFTMCWNTVQCLSKGMKCHDTLSCPSSNGGCLLEAQDFSLLILLIVAASCRRSSTIEGVELSSKLGCHEEPYEPLCCGLRIRDVAKGVPE